MSKKIYAYSVTQKKERTKKILGTIFFIIFFIAFVNLILAYLVFPVRQTSESMSPDFESGSLVLVTPITKTVKRGDVILLKPQTKTENGKVFVFCDKMVSFFTGQQFSLIEKKGLPGTQQKLRRVIALPGDTIYMRDYVMYIKPQGEKHFLTEFEFVQQREKQHPYNVTFMSVPPTWDNEIGVKGYFDEVVLGEDEYFVLGDNRKACDDSRLWGTVSHKDFYAKALVVYFPFSKFRILAR
ncbi:MAG: signal peptidase I [Treponema sp.]|nr:signal peptidase I [Treponema sp.]